MLNLIQISKINKKTEFDFSLLNEENLKEVIRYTCEHDQIILLLVCRKWNELFLPYIWESLVPSEYSYKPKDVKKAYRKNGHLIRHLNFTTSLKLPIFHGLYKNINEVSISLENYVKRSLFRYNFKITGLLINEYFDELNLEEFIFANELDLSSICKDLKYLEVPTITEYFVQNILPILPPTIKSAKFQNNEVENLAESVFTSFPNLINLELPYFYFSSEEWSRFQKYSFDNLRSLELLNNVYDPDEVIIDSSFMPQLTQLTCNATLIQFKGKLKLRDLTLENFRSDLGSFSNEKFPYLRVLTIRYSSSISFQLLRSIFELESLNKLVINYCHISIFQLDEVYPKKSNRLTSLKLIGCTLGYGFFRFLFTCCERLEELALSLGYCDDIPTLNEKAIRQIPFKKLNLTQLLIQNHCNRLNGIIEEILKHSPKLLNFKIDEIPYFSNTCLTKSLNKLKPIIGPSYLDYD